MGFVQHTRDGDIIEDVMVKELEKLLPSNPSCSRTIVVKLSKTRRE